MSPHYSVSCRTGGGFYMIPFIDFFKSVGVSYELILKIPKSNGLGEKR